tara:strand:+ start:208 stop:309 length:102 start_codon:yes stop_codon:yes gene_type:complete
MIISHSDKVDSTTQGRDRTAGIATAFCAAVVYS